MNQKFCLECGAPLDGGKFCTACGVKIPEQAVPVQAAAQMQQMTPVLPAESEIELRDVRGTKYEPVSTGGFIGITLLMLIPCINFIFLLVWTLGGCRKVQKTYWARANLIFMAIGLVLSVIIGFGAKALTGNIIPASLTGKTVEYERLIEAVENEDREALLNMGYSKKDINEVIGME